MSLQKETEILLVEDNPGDVVLIQEALKEGKIHNSLTVAKDGIEALAILRREGVFANSPRPDLILLDLNMPRMNGMEVLALVKSDRSLRTIPVVVLTTSSADQDIIKAYEFNANCYVTKPVDFNQFIKVIHTIDEFWLSIVKLPVIPD